MDYFALINMFLQAAPMEVALIKSIVDAIHSAHQNGQTPPVFVPVPPGAIPIQVPGPVPVAPPPAPVAVQMAAPAMPITQMPITSDAGQAPAMDANSQSVVVVGVPGQKRDRDLKVTATPGTAS